VPGPCILMAVLLVFLILFHMSLNSALDPLLVYLPRSLEAEEESLMALEDGAALDNGRGMSGDTAATEKGQRGISAGNGVQQGDGIEDGVVLKTVSTEKTLPPAPHKKPNFFTKWLAPHKFTDYATLRRLVPHNFADITYDEETERNAYYNPAISSPTPLLWIPRDEMGVSAQEVRHTSKVIPITDEDAFFDEKGNLAWGVDKGRPPIWSEKIYY